VSKELRPGLKWIEGFTALLAVADLDDWDVGSTADKLTFFLALRYDCPLDIADKTSIVRMFESWAESNDCVYRRSFLKGSSLVIRFIAKRPSNYGNNSPI